MQNRKAKLHILGVLSAICFLCCSFALIVIYNSVSLIGLRAVGNHQCSGNHYTELKETESNNGVKEYWVCCDCHTQYYSTKEISNYNKSDWADVGTASLVSGSETRLINSPLLSTYTKPGTSGFTVNGNSFVGSTTHNGWIMSTETYYNYSVDISVDSKASHNPWGDHYATNAFILNGKTNNGRLYGYALDFQTDFIQLIYLPDISSRDENHGGNVFFAHGGGYSSAHVDVIGDTFYLTVDGTLAATVKLNRHWYQEGWGEELNLENLYYEAGSIGYLGYADDDGVHYARKMTISNFMKRNSNIFANTTYNSGNGFTLSNNQVTLNTGSSSGWMYTNDTYTDVSLMARVDAGANDNIFSDHITRNSILIGGGYSDGHLTGYVLEFQANHVEIAKLTGSEDYQTGDATVMIGYWDWETGWFTTGGKDIFITISGNVITVSSMDGAWRPSGKDEYPTGSYTMEDYSGGYLGYLFNDNTSHTINVTKLS